MTVIPVPDVCTSDRPGKDDVLRGTYRRAVICGGDTSCGRGANVLLRGGVSDDTVRGAEGDAGDDDRLFGGAGTDLLPGGSG